MNNYELPEKSKGIVIFAYNTDTVDYISIARNTARLAKHILGLPVCLITDCAVHDPVFDCVKLHKLTADNIKNCHQQSWRNLDRFLAYELSPWDRTLLMDSDYLVLDTGLLKILDTVKDYTFYHNNHVLDTSVYELMGFLSMPYAWATVVAFAKTSTSENLFQLVGRIQRNYNYYTSLYNIASDNFRNDYAFTLASTIINGYCSADYFGIPWPMTSIFDQVTDIKMNNNRLTVRTGRQAYVLPRKDIHITDKDFLQSNSFANFIEDLCKN